MKRLGTAGVLLAGVPSVRGQVTTSAIPFREIDRLDVSCRYAYRWRYERRDENEYRVTERTKRYRYRDVLEKQYDLENEIGYYAIYTEGDDEDPEYPWQLHDSERYYHTWSGGWTRTRRNYVPGSENWILSARARIHPRRNEYTLELPTVYYDRRVVSESSDGPTRTDEGLTPLYGFPVRRPLPDALPVRGRTQRPVPTSYGTGTERARWVVRRARGVD